MTDSIIWALLFGLLALSGFLSASETALFSLSAGDRESAGARVQRLFREPREVLVSILLANLLVNLAFFATAPHFLMRVADLGLLGAGFVSLLAILILGEILPKTLALRGAHWMARWAAWPLSLLVGLLSPMRRVLRGLVDLGLKAFGQSDSEEVDITPEVLAEVLERSSVEGVLAAGEADLLAEIVELGDLRVREIMTPRVDMLLIDLDDDEVEQREARRQAARRRLSWLPVVRGGADNVVGQVLVRDLYRDQDRPIEQLIMPIKFVPEVARVLSLLHSLREDRVAEAIVLDEWGGTAGAVTLEDFFEELIGDLRVEGEALERPVVPLGEGRFRVSGGLSIRDWNDHFGVQVVPREFETVGGFVTALLGRIPRTGDRLELGGGLICEVREVRGRRLETLDLFVAADGDGGRAERSGAIR
ncbi:MAG: putative hemolysin [Chlamydiales bacterium]|jgi:putative hemolysin